MRLFCWKWSTCLVLMGACGMVSQADVVHLKNGRSLEGTVVKETDTHITINLGLGTMTVHRAKVERIEKGSAADKQAFEKANREKYITSKQYVPKGYENLMRGYDDLYKQRHSFINQWKQLHAYDRTVKSLTRTNRELSVLAKKQFAETEAAKGGSRKAYNQKVQTYNQTVTKMKKSRASLESKRREADRASRAFVNQVKQLTDYEEQLIEAHKQADPEDEAVKRFLEALAGKMDALRKEFGPEFEYRPPGEHENLHAIVDARINDRVTTPMIVDSGASGVVISRAVAKELGLDLSKADRHITQVADGRYVRSLEVNFDSITVNGHTAEKVKGFVLDTGGLSDKGLLGMTFLRRFNWRIDPDSSEFIIEE